MTTDNRPIPSAAAADVHAPEAASRPAAKQGAATMEGYLFFGHVIDTLAQGSAFRGYFARFLRISAAVIVFAGLVALVDAWKFISRQEAAGILGGIVYMVCLAAGVYMVVHATILRAGHIASLPDGEFTLIPLCAVLSLLAGEAYAAFSASVSLGGGLLIWFTRGNAYNLLRDVSWFVPSSGGTDFLAGILFMVRGLVRAALVLTGGYLASELFLVVGRLGEKGPGMFTTKE